MTVLSSDRPVYFATRVALILLITLLGTGQALAAPAFPAWRQNTPFSTETATVRIADVQVIAEIADTTPLRTRGLGFRDELSVDGGMLFVFDTPSQRTFWMNGMRICLDIIWIDAGKIVGAAEDVCPEPGKEEADLTRYQSPVPVEFVLEVNGGWMASNDLQVGSEVDIQFPVGYPVSQAVTTLGDS